MSEWNNYVEQLRRRADAFGETMQERWAPTLNQSIPQQREDAAGKFQNPKGGLNDAGRKHFGVKKGVTNYSGASEEDKKRWVRWALRFTKTAQPLKDDNDQPTRYALMFRAWGEPIPTSPAAVSAVHKKAQARSKQLKMGENAAALDDADFIDLGFTSENDFWEDVASAADGPGEHTGVMIAFFPTEDQAQQLALRDGEPVDELHVTLAFLGEVGAELDPDQEQPLIDAVTAWAATKGPISAETNGLGLFANPQPVTYASIDAPGLPGFRQSLVEALDAAGLPAVMTHGYTPHMTLAYADRRDIDVPKVPMTFTDVTVAFAGQRTRIPLGSSAPVLQVQERTPPQPVAAAEQGERAFVVEVNGRTLVTAPARAAAYNEPTLEEISDNPMLYMHGRFVGADEPNRNGAMWSAGDLQMANATVMHGPLNWLHEGRHIIGTLAKSQFHSYTQEYAAKERAAGRNAQPHIAATAAIWRWIYPDESYVVQQASDLGQLWYSMECISKEVACAGPNGCGSTTSYSQYLAGSACEHIAQRASVRQFISPVFLGGAVIVPPTRPGWADADASVMATATGLAEAAFEQAGQPDVSATQWEQLMAQLVRFAG